MRASGKDKGERRESGKDRGERREERVEKIAEERGCKKIRVK